MSDPVRTEIDSFESVWRKVAALAGAYDLAAITAPSILVWVYWFEAADLRVFALVTVVRLAGLFALLRWLYRGLHTHRNLAQLGASELLDFEQQLRRAPGRFAQAFAASVILALATTTAVNELGWVDAVPMTTGQLRMLAVLLLGLALGVSPMVTSLLVPPLLDLRAEIGARLSQLGADERREESSLVGWSAGLNVPYLLCIFFCMVGVFGKFAVDGWQTAAIEGQRLRISEAARALDNGGDLDDVLSDPGLRIVEDPAELPTKLVEQDSTTGAGLAGIDVDTNNVVAVQALSDQRWLIGESPLDDRSGLIWMFALGFPLLFTGPLAFANLAATRAQTRQLSELRAVTRQVLAGTGLQGIVRFRPPTNDEIGRLVREFNEMLDVLTELVGAAHIVAAGDLTVKLERPGDFHDAFRGMLSSLQEVVAQVHETAVELGAAAEDIRSGIGAQEHAVEEQSRIVAEVSAAVRELVVAAGAIGTSAHAVLVNADETEQNATSMVGQITSLGESVDKIGGLLESIRGIAGRSDLLALNGSLEATRAGEAGRGFSIVAAEMRRLSEQIAGTAVEVGARVTEVGNVGVETIRVTEQTRERSRVTAAAAGQIAELTRQQGDETERISVAMQRVSASVSQTSAATGHTAEAAEQLAHRAARLTELTRGFRLED